MSSTGKLLSAKLTNHNPRSWIFRLVLASLWIILSSCGGKPKPPEPEEISETNYHFYIILSPINEQASKDARLFLMNAKKSYSRKSQMFFPNSRYTIIQVCQEKELNFQSTGQRLSDDEKQLSENIESMTSGAENALTEIERKRKNGEPCNASAKSLLRLSTNLYDAASKDRGDKLIILLQAPWSPEEVATVFPELKTGMSKLAKTNKVERIFLFGVPPTDSDKTSKAFEEFDKDNPDVFSTAPDLAQTLEGLESIRENLLKQK